MKNLYGPLLLLFCSCSAFSQRITFHFTDTSFTLGSVYTACDIHYDLDGHGTVMDSSIPCLDSMADFMKRHPELIFEIASYTDQRGGDSSNLQLSQSRANIAKKHLVKQGVSESCLVAVGYGEQFPLVPQKQIDTAKSKQTKEQLYQQNRRTEFKILHIYNKHFTLTDSVFEPGDLMRCHILFDFNKATIRPEAYPLLDSIAKFLIAHPNLIIEVNNHRDTRGSDMYSSDLSTTRSRSVCEYLVAKGVPREQVMYKGYGETMPLISEAYINANKSKEAQEQLHQVNRRTELRIVTVK